MGELSPRYITAQISGITPENKGDGGNEIPVALLICLISLVSLAIEAHKRLCNEAKAMKLTARLGTPSRSKRKTPIGSKALWPNPDFNIGSAPTPSIIAFNMRTE